MVVVVRLQRTAVVGDAKVRARGFAFSKVEVSGLRGSKFDQGWFDEPLGADAKEHGCRSGFTPGDSSTGPLGVDAKGHGRGLPSVLFFAIKCDDMVSSMTMF